VNPRLDKRLDDDRIVKQAVPRRLAGGLFSEENSPSSRRIKSGRFHVAGAITKDTKATRGIRVGRTIIFRCA
jgi:hypothetical protein